MAQCENTCTFVGNLGADPELRSTQGGTPVCSFRMATTESWKKDGQDFEDTQWHNIVAWRELATICDDLLRKGSRVYVKGKAKNRTYEKDGAKRYVTEYHIDKMINLTAAEESSPKAGIDEI